MLEDYLKIYEADTIRLAKLLTVKFSDIATLMNEKVMMTYGTEAVIPTQPETWKYYLNISGSYHPTDIPMTVYSLDTAEMILFSKENMNLHTATKETYSLLKTEYYQLVDQYPEQELLIRGILFPTDIDTAINAEEGTILAYPQDLIESREITLLYDLETWIKNYLVRWNVQAFMTSDSLYVAAYQAVLYLNIVSRLFSLRSRRIHTHEVHSFHVRAFLGSHGRLDKYYDYLTDKQRLWLYRNLPYIENHSGLKPVFENLVEHLLTERHIPIAEYTARQYTGFDEKYYPNYHYRKKPLNTTYNIPEKNYYTLEEIQVKEQDLAPGNKEYWAFHYDKIEKQFQNSGNAVMLTKDLESFMFDYSNSVPHSLPSILLNEWGYRAFTEDYHSLITFKDPNKSISYTVTTDVAFVYFMYLAYNAIGYNLTTLPTVFGFSINKLYKGRTFDETVMNEFAELMHVPGIVKEIITSMPKATFFYSTRQFFNYAYTLYQQRISHWLTISNRGSMYDRGHMEILIDQMFFSTKMDFSGHPRLNPDHLSMQDWLIINRLPINDLTQSQRLSLMAAIFDKATGQNIDKTKQLRYIQKAMIDILRQLSSYSIQVFAKINELDIRPVNWPVIRPGHMNALLKSYDIFRHEVTVTNINQKQKFKQTASLFDFDNTHVKSKKLKRKINYNPFTEFKIQQGITDEVRYSLKSYSVRTSSGSLFMNLTPIQIANLM